MEITDADRAALACPPQVRRVCVAATQFRCSTDAATNLDTAEALVRDAARKGAQIILLQELFATLYFCKDEREVCAWHQSAVSSACVVLAAVHLQCLPTVATWRLTSSPACCAHRTCSILLRPRPQTPPSTPCSRDSRRWLKSSMLCSPFRSSSAPGVPTTTPSQCSTQTDLAWGCTASPTSQPGPATRRSSSSTPCVRSKRVVGDGKYGS